MNNPTRELKPDAQAFDEVRITTVPRYKTSGLSGDEWRISGKIELLRKGNVIHEQFYNSVEAAVKYLPMVWGQAIDEGKAMFAGEGEFCDQEGCSDKATVFYKLKKDYCDKGEAHEIKYGDRIRQFCDRHSRRGDCGMQDSDDNYELLSGNPIEPREEDVKPAIFGGTVQIDNIENAPALIDERIKEIREGLIKQKGT